jgi:protease II
VAEPGSLVLLKTNLEAGHAGASGRYDFLKEVALDYAFLIDRLGVRPDGATQGRVKASLQGT